MSFRTSTLIEFSEAAAVIACFHSFGAQGASVRSDKPRPRLTPAAPSMSAAAMPRPSKIPPSGYDRNR